LEKDNAASNIEVKQSFELQSELNKHLQQLLNDQVVQNKAQTDLILTLQAAINDLKESLQSIEEIQKDSSNVTASCKAIVHSFSLTDPFDWYNKHFYKNRLQYILIYLLTKCNVMKTIILNFRWYEYRNNVENTFLDISGWQWITSQWPMTLITFVMTLFWRYNVIYNSK
jgi:hypothetical protein